MHPDEEIDIRDVLGKHIQPAQFPISLAEQLNQFHIVQNPRAMDQVWQKAFVMAVRDKAAGLEVLHGAASSYGKISILDILDFTRKLK